MTAYLVRRIIQSIVVVFGVTIIVFIILHALPGGPARGLLGPEASAQQVRQFAQQNGYDDPLVVQYGRFIGQLARGNLGYSYHYNQNVSALLAEDLPKSAVLVGLSYLVALIIAIPLGILQALRRNSLADYVTTGASFIAYSMPSFWLGILLILGFAVSWKLLPPEGPQGATITAVLAHPNAMILPVATLALITVAAFSRFMRSSAIETLVQDYIRTARAMGVPERTILARHLLRNSLIPIITLIGLSLPATISGAVITESVFNYPGMGLLFWTSATSHDFPVLLGSTVVFAVATVVGSMLADMLYAVVDPRVRYS
ncbi:MAG TPA: ABC transporter permease [Streptosporangiaceae bacterium]|jgi:peptide/nickel transport system permease protein